MSSDAAQAAIFLFSLSTIVLLLMRWGSAAMPSPGVEDAMDSGKWAGACISMLLRVTEVVGRSGSFGRKAARTITIGVLLLGIVWPMVGWLSGKVMGFSGTPWQLFDQFMELMARTSASQPAQAQVHAWATAATRGAWGYVYAGCAIVVISFWSATAFWCAGAVSRYLLHDLQTSETLAQKSGLLLGLAAFSLLLWILLTFFIGLVISPAPWLAALLARAGLSWWADIGLIIAANAFTFYFSDPWLKGLLLVCLFPCLFPLVFAGSALVADIWRIGATRSKERLLTTSREKLGRAFVPFLMALMALYCAYWILSRLF